MKKSASKKHTYTQYELETEQQQKKNMVWDEKRSTQKRRSRCMKKSNNSNNPWKVALCFFHTFLSLSVGRFKVNLIFANRMRTSLFTVNSLLNEKFNNQDYLVRLKKKLFLIILQCSIFFFNFRNFSLFYAILLQTLTISAQLFAQYNFQSICVLVFVYNAKSIWLSTHWKSYNLTIYA